MKKKNSKTQRALNLAAKLGEIGPPPELPELALDKNRIMKEKQEKALQVWAFQKMGQDFKKFFDLANRNFWTLVYLAVMVHGKDLTTALKETPFFFSLKPTQKQLVTFDPFKFKEEFDRLLPSVQAAKSKTRHNPAAQRMALAEALGITDRKTIARYLEMKASDIALDHLLSKHKLTVGIETIHKHLSLVRHPMKMGKRIIETIAKEVGVKLK